MRAHVNNFLLADLRVCCLVKLKIRFINIYLVDHVFK